VGASAHYLTPIMQERLHPAALAAGLLGLVVVIPVAVLIPFLAPLAGAGLVAAGIRLRRAYADRAGRALGWASVFVGVFLLAVGAWLIASYAL
jgi:hypothetical protein